MTWYFIIGKEEDIYEDYKMAVDDFIDTLDSYTDDQLEDLCMTNIMELYDTDELEEHCNKYNLDPREVEPAFNWYRKEENREERENYLYDSYNDL